MKISKIIGVILTIFLASIFLASISYYIYYRYMDSRKAETPEAIVIPKEVEKEAPVVVDDTSVPNYTVTTKNGSKIFVVKTYDENIFKGKKSLVFFWASWCPHCIEEIAVIKQTMIDYSNKGYNIYAISHDNDLDTLISFMEKEDIQFNVYFDKGRIIRKAIDPPANTIPLIYAINENISIGKKYEGSSTKVKVAEFISFIETGK